MLWCIVSVLSVKLFRGKLQHATNNFPSCKVIFPMEPEITLTFKEEENCLSLLMLLFKKSVLISSKRYLVWWYFVFILMLFAAGLQEVQAVAHLVHLPVPVAVGGVVNKVFIPACYLKIAIAYCNGIFLHCEDLT